MSKVFKQLINILVNLFLITSIYADDGMWMPHQMESLNLKELGLEMDPDDLYKKDGSGIMSAVVYLGGGTGSFVSKEGLILTNHHVAFGAIQKASSPDHDYITHGYFAENKEQEIHARGYIADVLQGYEDITKSITKHLRPDMSFKQRYDAIDKAKKEIIAKAEKAEDDIRCEIKSMYSGNKYYLFKSKRLLDVRIVYAPPEDLGNFGGDIDNWMWPRHTCDFTFLRAYVSKDNKGVEYNKKNVPYKPKSVLKLSLEGVDEGDFTFVMGYPGKTYRNFTLSELLFDLNRMEKRVKKFEGSIKFFEDASKGNRKIEIKYARKLKGLNNALKNYRGKIEGIEKVGLADMKKEQEMKILDWIKQDNSRKQKYGEVLNKIDDFMKRYSDYFYKNLRLKNIVSRYFGPKLLMQAHQVYKIVQERQKPDIERDAKYQERNIPLLRMRMKFAERGYDFETDKAYFIFYLKNIFNLSSDQIPDALREIADKKSENEISEKVEQIYNSTIIRDAKKRLQLLEMSLDDLMNLNDPLINLAAELEKEMKKSRDEGEIVHQERNDLKKVHLEAVLQQKKDFIAPDANGSIRFTYGNLEGYSPRDAVYYKPITTLKGVIEKDTGEKPFHVPLKLKQLYLEKDYGTYIDKKLNDVPTCFLNTTNVTGGNSGSPTINSKGEQVGIIFDMTYESVIGDYYVIPELQRTISVDVRYVLFITEKFGGATYLLKEMGM